MRLGFSSISTRLTPFRLDVTIWRRFSPIGVDVCLAWIRFHLLASIFALFSPRICLARGHRRFFRRLRDNFRRSGCLEVADLGLLYPSGVFYGPIDVDLGVWCRRSKHGALAGRRGPISLPSSFGGVTVDGRHLFCRLSVLRIDLARSTFSLFRSDLFAISVSTSPLSPFRRYFTFSPRLPPPRQLLTRPTAWQSQDIAPSGISIPTDAAPPSASGDGWAGGGTNGAADVDRDRERDGAGGGGRGGGGRGRSRSRSPGRDGERG